MRIIIIIRQTASLCLFLLLMDGVCADEVCVTEGDSVTLHTNVTDIQSRDQILWTFGPKETRIAEIYKQDIDMFESDQIFGHRLQMDSQTGSLTITHITSEHTGLYKLTVIRNSGKSLKTFNVSVYARLPAPVITRNSSDCSSSSSRCSLVCSVCDVSDVTLSWYKGNSLLSSISVSDLSISLSLPLEVEYQDLNTYSCVLNNPITHTHTHLENITELCHKSADCSGSRTHAVLLSVFAVLLAVLAIVMFSLYRKCRRSRPKGNYYEPPAHAAEPVQTEPEEVAYTETMFVQNVQNKKPKGTEETIYSTVQR